MKVEIWSDVVCPWCYIGKRRFERALRYFEHRDQVVIEWRSFELDPEAPRRSAVNTVDRLATKYRVSREQAVAMTDRVTKLAAEEGLDYRLDVAQQGNTLDAHRLLHLATERGRQEALEERLFRAYFTEAEPIGQPDALVRLAAEAGLDAAEAEAVLDGEAYTDQVRADQREAAELGIEGVPFFVIDRRFGVSGAQTSDVLLQALRRAWAESHPALEMAGGGEDSACTDDSCSV